MIHLYRAELQKTVGKGTVIAFGAGIIGEHDYKMNVYKDLLDYIGIEQPFHSSEWLHLAMRTGDLGSFIFIIQISKC